MAAFFVRNKFGTGSQQIRYKRGSNRAKSGLNQGVDRAIRPACNPYVPCTPLMLRRVKRTLAIIQRLSCTLLKLFDNGVVFIRTIKT